MSPETREKINDAVQALLMEWRKGHQREDRLRDLADSIVRIIQNFDQLVNDEKKIR